MSRPMLTRRNAGLTLLAACSAWSRPAKAANRKLVVGALLLTPSSGFFIAKERGYFRDAGIEVELKPFTNAQQIATAVVSGDLDIGLTGITAGLYNLAGKGGLRIIGATAREEPGYHLNAFLATNAAYAGGLKRVADIGGKRLGVTTVGSTGHYSIGVAARKYGVALASIRVIPLQTVPNLQAAFKGGQLDGVVIPFAAAGQLVAEGAGHVIGWVGDETPWQTNAILTSPRLIARDRAAVQGFITAYQRGAADYAAAFNPRDASGNPADGPVQRDLLALLARITGEQPDRLRAGLAYINPQGHLLLQDLFDQVVFWKQQRLVDDDVDVRSFLDLSFTGQPNDAGPR